MLRVCERACAQHFQGRFELRISSTEILDALFEECQVELADRLPLMKLLYYLQHDSQKFNTKEIREEFDTFKKRFNYTKLFDLIKIRGTVDHIERQLKQKSHILCKKRFITAIEYLKRLRDNLAIFGLTEKDDNKVES